MMYEHLSQINNTSKYIWSLGIFVLHRRQNTGESMRIGLRTVYLNGMYNIYQYIFDFTVESIILQFDDLSRTFNTLDKTQYTANFSALGCRCACGMAYFLLYIIKLENFEKKRANRLVRFVWIWANQFIKTINAKEHHTIPKTALAKWDERFCVSVRCGIIQLSRYWTATKCIMALKVYFCVFVYLRWWTHRCYFAA